MAKKPSTKAQLKEMHTKYLVADGHATFYQKRTADLADMQNKLADALRAFTFPHEPQQFLGFESNLTKCFLKDIDVQRARFLIKQLEG